MKGVESVADELPITQQLASRVQQVKHQLKTREASHTIWQAGDDTLVQGKLPGLIKQK